MDDRPQIERAYFELPQTRWSDVAAEFYGDLRRLQTVISVALAEMERAAPTVVMTPLDQAIPEAIGAAIPLTPSQVSLQLTEVASRLLAAAAGDEQDLRQIITTLRTALAVCLDLYGVRESEQITVSQHMYHLRDRIEEFERDLHNLQLTQSEPENPEPA